MPLPLRRKSRRLQALPLGGSLADLGQPGLVLLLLRRLRRRDELLVGGDPRRDRRRGFRLGVEIALADPHDLLQSHGLAPWIVRFAATAGKGKAFFLLAPVATNVRHHGASPWHPNPTGLPRGSLGSLLQIATNVRHHGASPWHPNPTGLPRGSLGSSLQKREKENSLKTSKAVTPKRPCKYGYRPEFRRELKRFASFAIGFSFISITTGIFTTYGYVLANSGPLGIWTWPLVIVGQLFVSLVFATLGLTYSHWRAILTSGRRAWQIPRWAGLSAALLLLPDRGRGCS